MPDPDRLAVVEAELAALHVQLDEIRAELRSLRAPATAPGTPDTHSRGRAHHEQPFHRTTQSGDYSTARSVAPAASAQLEKLAGRYGTLALSVVTLVIAVGALISWASEHIHIGPAARVGAGAVAALLVGAVGAVMRRRTRGYGNALMGIALAMLHAVAWGAGPTLGVIPIPAAFVAVVAASAALAALAWHEDDQPLFALGLAGALLAPFVISGERGNLLILLGYGLVVVTLSLVAIRKKTNWDVVERLLVAGCGVYVISAILAGGATAVDRAAPAVFALACAWSALPGASAKRRAPIIYSTIVLAALALIVAAGRSSGFAVDVITLAAVGAGTAYVALSAVPTSGPRPELYVIGLPLAFLAAALLAVPEVKSLSGITISGIWLVGPFVLAATDDPERRAAHLTTGATALLIGILCVPAEPSALVVGALAAHATVFSVILRRHRAAALAFPVVAALLTASAIAGAEISDRVPYGYTPFLTRASLAALFVCLGWWGFAWHTSRAEIWHDERATKVFRPLVRLLGAIATFVWVRAELAGAYSGDAAMFLLIAYYAASGVAAIFLGRIREIPVARRIGLGLAFFAAVKAIGEATAVVNIAFRVGSYAVVGVFLLGVAYWYRSTGTLRTADDALGRIPT